MSKPDWLAFWNSITTGMDGNQLKSLFTLSNIRRKCTNRF